MNVSTNILAKSLNFKKMRHGFVDKGTTITTALTSSCQWKILVPFCLRNKIPKNAFLTLTVNYCKSYRKTNYGIQNSVKLAT